MTEVAPVTGGPTAADGDRHRDVRDRAFQMLIDGRWRAAAGGRTFACLDPYTEESWGSVPEADAADVDDAVAAAARAFEDSGWRHTPPGQRAALLRRLADLIDEHADELTRRQILENGKLVTEMGPGIGAVSGDCRFFAGLGETLHGHTVGSHLPNSAAYTLREPIGVVGVITPWNTPLGLLGWKLFPALAAGNTVVVKPSEVTPTSTLRLAELAMEAGFPPGVVNVVTGHGAVGAALVAHPRVDKIAFTGSTATGRRIAAVAGERIARVSLELGGKSPNIIFADADLDSAVSGVMAGIFAATGQSCMAGSRVLVQETIYEDVAERLVARGRALRMGDPLDPNTELGPVASPSQLRKVLGYVDTGVTEGAVLRGGGARPDRRGLFVEPTVFTGVTNEHRIAREEIFGPVASLIPFREEAEAIRLANDTSYGLAAAVWTESLRRAHRVVRALRAGTVWVNNYRIVGRTMPFGGFKQSGIGRELGLDALEVYTEVKSVWIDFGDPVVFPPR